MDLITRYSSRLGIELADPAVDGPRQPDAVLDSLRRLHALHLRRIPFENLSNHLDEALSLDQEVLADKILTGGRGGFCYELNGLFSMLLVKLGYAVTLLGARVGDGAVFGPPLDHLLLRVGVEGEGDWLVDVGFGDNSVYPVPWVPGVEHQDPGGSFRLEPVSDGAVDLYRNGVIQYRIEPNRRVLKDFEAMCWYHQHSPDSHFTQALVCSLLTDEGRVTLSGRRLITTDNTGRHELELTDDAELLRTYADVFGIRLARLPTIPEAYRSQHGTE